MELNGKSMSILTILPSGSCHLNYEREFSASASSFGIVHDHDDVYVHAHKNENDFFISQI